MAHVPQAVRIGFAGCGAVATHLHLPALRALRDVEVVAVADQEASRAEAAAARFGVPRWHADYRELVGDPALDAVAVCVPPGAHAEVALAALDAGKHVLIEKPVTLALDECDRIAARAFQAGRKVLVGFNLRWHRLIRRARAMVRQGVLGQPESVRTALTAGLHAAGDPGWRRRRALGGGAFHDLGVHHFDLWRYLTGQEVAEVYAQSRSEESEDEIASVTGRMTGGILVSALFSGRTAEGNEAEIHGPEGTLRISCYRFDGFEFARTLAGPGSLGARAGRLAFGLRELPGALVRLRSGGEVLATYREQWRHFAAAIRHDAPLESTLDDGRRALEVSLAAIASASRRVPVEVSVVERS